MVNPDRSFMRQLKELDRRLNCVFRPEHEHFVITYDRGHGEPVNICMVKAEDGGFRQPNRTDLDFVFSGDLERMSKAEFFQRASKYSADYALKMERNRRDTIRGATKDDKIQLMNAYNRAANISKANSAFRRIDHKPGKNVVATA
jgi:hypothetical protein